MKFASSYSHTPVRTRRTGFLSCMSLVHWTTYFVPYSNTQMLHLQCHYLIDTCFSVPSTAQSLIRGSPMILIELWTKLGSGRLVRQRQRQSGPYTKFYNLSNKSILITRQLSIIEQRLAFRLLLIIGDHTSSSAPQFIVHRPRNAFRIVLMHTWPKKKSILVDHSDCLARNQARYKITCMQLDHSNKPLV